MTRPADIGSLEADFDPSTDRYAERFAGPTGSWLLARQTAALEHLAAPWPAARVLDVGGGHGQIARPLLKTGHDVTVLASSEAAFGQAARLRDRGLKLVVGSLMDPPFADQSFDIVVSFRIMAHIGDWPRYLSGLARVARKAVIVDFPTPGGANALEPILFSVKKKLEGDTRRYDVIGKAEIRETFSDLGFEPAGEVGQFVLPMVLHRKLKAPMISGVLEGVLAGAGLAKAFGTPVVIAARRLP